MKRTIVMEGFPMMLMWPRLRPWLSASRRSRSVEAGVQLLRGRTNGRAEYGVDAWPGQTVVKVAGCHWLRACHWPRAY
jgi:hypothetical protein